ncbi:MAG: hypothetical protein J5759_04590 [Bacteroidales bacterium]|nr:hypothetical protein [Bacteroidales bacterium]
MQNKLQELTDQLYNQGLAKGREEGDRYLEQAKREAEATVAAARHEAEDIIANAEKAAFELRSKAEADIRMASAQALQATRKDIENLVVAKIGAQSATADPAFLKEIILKVAERFSATEGSDIALVLPDSLRAELEPWVQASLAKALGAPVQASFSKKISGGFTIGPKDGSYFVSMTDKTFEDLICEYLRPVTRKLLFGE